MLLVHFDQPVHSLQSRIQLELIIPFYCSNTGVFVSNEAYDYANSNLYNSFHFAHMLILFIGLTFILQAILIIVLVASRKVNIINWWFLIHVSDTWNNDLKSSNWKISTTSYDCFCNAFNFRASSSDLVWSQATSCLKIITNLCHRTISNLSSFGTVPYQYRSQNFERK